MRIKKLLKMYKGLSESLRFCDRDTRSAIKGRLAEIHDEIQRRVKEFSNDVAEARREAEEAKCEAIEAIENLRQAEDESAAKDAAGEKTDEINELRDKLLLRDAMIDDLLKQNHDAEFEVGKLTGEIFQKNNRIEQLTMNRLHAEANPGFHDEAVIEGILYRKAICDPSKQSQEWVGVTPNGMPDTSDDLEPYGGSARRATLVVRWMAEEIVGNTDV